MTVDSISRNIAKIVINELLISSELQIDKDTKLIEIGVDSVALMMLLVFIEEQYGIEIGEDALIGEGFDSLGDIAEYVYSKLNM